MTMRDSGDFPDAVAGCIVALDRCDSLVSAVPLQAYGERPPGQASIGAHLRHSLDHFAAFLRGLPESVIDYDERARDTRLECDPTVARGVIVATREAVAALNESMLGKTLIVRQIAAPARPPVALHSTVARELVFLSQHTIHHLALMISVACMLGLDLRPISRWLSPPPRTAMTPRPAWNRHTIPGFGIASRERRWPAGIRSRYTGGTRQGR
ncbi:MAG: DinB family protein [Candidatus Competibacteraceae bacterium]|nr:DinB family protein [Candidatus Competibacteraceae bacterium]